MNDLSYTDIANMALDWCGGAISLDSIDNTNNPDAVLCKRNLKIAIKSELDKYEWAFARKRLEVAAIDEDDDHYIEGYNGYALPNDFSRLSMLTFYDDQRIATNPYIVGPEHFIQDGYLYSVMPITVLKYNSNNVAIYKWHTLFCDVVALNLAQRIAPKIKGMDADVAFFEQMYRAKLKDARRLELIGTEAVQTGKSDLQYQRMVING